jgi:menaquinone-dependent protoporphyrinogen oxidase
MAKKILVAYGTRYGATAGIAERIGEVLKKAGFTVDVASADKAGEPGGYDAVILGSALYIGQWRKEAANYLAKHEQALAKLPVWLFSSGPAGKGDVKELMNGFTFPEKLKPVAERTKPRDNTVFHGVVDFKKLNFLEKFVMNNMKIVEGDYRDWTAIDAWAEGIAKELKK